MHEADQRARLSTLCHWTHALHHVRIRLIGQYVGGNLSRQEAREQLALAAEAIGDATADAIAAINTDRWSLGARLGGWHDALLRA